MTDARAGEEFDKEFSDFFRDTYKSTVNHVRRLTRRHVTAEDYAQHSYLEAWRAWDIVSELLEPSRRSWVKTVAWRAALKESTAWARTDIDLDEIPVHLAPVHAPPTASVARQVELRMAWADTIRALRIALPTHQANIASLYLIGGYEYREISQLVGLSESTVRVHVHRARTALQSAHLLLNLDAVYEYEASEGVDSK